MSHDHVPSRTYATIELRKARGRQRFRWALRVLGTNDTNGPQENYANASHTLRMAVRGTGFQLDYADLSDPAYVKLYGHNPYYAIEVVGWNRKQAASVFGEDALGAAADPEIPNGPWPIVTPDPPTATPL